MSIDDPVRPLIEVPNLREALHRAREENAERASALTDIREMQIARLEILRDALQPVFSQVPDGANLFDHGLVPGETPRLYVDVLAYVELARDRRSYRFVRDTRWGQKPIAETDNLQTAVDAVAHYIAARLIEREKALRADSLAPSPLMEAAPGPAAFAPKQPKIKASPARDSHISSQDSRTSSEEASSEEAWVRPMLIGFLCLFAGLSLGVGALLAMGALRTVLTGGP